MTLVRDETSNIEHTWDKLRYCDGNRAHRMVPALTFSTANLPYFWWHNQTRHCHTSKILYRVDVSSTAGVNAKMESATKRKWK